MSEHRKYSAKLHERHKKLPDFLRRVKSCKSNDEFKIHPHTVERLSSSRVHANARSATYTAVAINALVISYFFRVYHLPSGIFFILVSSASVSLKLLFQVKKRKKKKFRISLLQKYYWLIKTKFIHVDSTKKNFYSATYNIEACSYHYTKYMFCIKRKKNDNNNSIKLPFDLFPIDFFTF